MKNVSIDYSYLTIDLLKAVAKAYPDGFKENDVIRLSEVNSELKNRIKVVLNDTVFLIKEADLNKENHDLFDDDYFDIVKNDELNRDGDYFEED